MLQKQFDEILALIKSSRESAVLSVNRELIELYWNIGKYICNKISDASWGKGVVKNLSEYIYSQVPDIKGFSPQNLWRMKQFFETYQNDKKLSALLRELSWTNNLLILSKTSSKEERAFYLKCTIKEKYSSRELERQIDSGLYERFILSDKNASAVLREIHPKSIEVFKDNYMLDFLSMSRNYSEQDLRKRIIAHLKDFILEFGKDFTFVGEEYRVQVGTKDFYVDLLFYYRELQALVAFDLKVTDFKPEFLGKMEFYLEALDRDVKKNHEKPSVGIVLCKSKDEQVVEYALSRTVSPAMVSHYETELIDKRVLQQKLNEFFLLEENKSAE